MKYGELTLGQIEAIVNKMGGMSGVDRFLEGEVVLAKKSSLTTFSTFTWAWRQAEEKAYQMMGLSEKYLAFRKEADVGENEGRWTSYMINGSSYERIISALKQSGSGLRSSYDNLDHSIVTNARHPENGSYVFSIAANVEADPENANKSANDLVKENHQGMTVMERLFDELVHLMMTGKHLDQKNVTLCTGSRSTGGSVPGVYWDSDSREVRVNWCSAGSRDGNMRSRSVVSS